jgi:polyisoprenoid-binding protein YceI
VRPVCAPAVSGEIEVEDRATMRGVRGVVAIRGEALTSGLRLRDVYTNDLLDVNKYPEIRFRIDSLTRVQPGDTVRATAVGTLSLHGVDRPMSVPVTAWSEGGGTRVKGQFTLNVKDLTETYGMSKYKLGLGVGTGIWQLLHLGVDVVLREGQVKTSR